MKKVIVIGVSGPSCSGKSTTAKALHQLCQGSLLIHQDDFYRPDSQIPFDNEKGEQDWDCPEALDFALFLQTLDELRSTGDLLKEIASLEPDAKLLITPAQAAVLTQRLKPLEAAPLKLVFVDGFMLYHDPAIVEALDVRLFLHASYLTLKQRRELRDVYVTKEGTWVDPPGYFDKMVWPAYIATHQQLFEGGDMAGALAPEAALRLRSRATDADSLPTIIEWAVDEIIAAVGSLYERS